MSIFYEKFLTKSTFHQMKPKQKKITFTSIEKIWDLFSMRLGSGWKKRANMCKVQKNVSIFENN